MLSLVRSYQGYAQIPYLNYGVSQSFVVGGGATPSPVSSLPLDTGCILIQANVDVRFKISYNGDDAGEQDPLVWARTDFFVGFIKNHRISFIKEAGQDDGVVIITPLGDSL